MQLCARKGGIGELRENEASVQVNKWGIHNQCFV